MKSNLWDVCILMVSALKIPYQCKLLIVRKGENQRTFVSQFLPLTAYVLSGNKKLKKTKPKEEFVLG